MPSILVLADAFAPGWDVTVDGAPRRLWQANHLVRGVMVRPGDRRVEFIYHAPGLRFGIGAALSVWAAWNRLLVAELEREAALALPGSRVERADSGPHPYARAEKRMSEADRDRRWAFWHPDGETQRPRWHPLISDERLRALGLLPPEANGDGAHG